MAPLYTIFLLVTSAIIHAAAGMTAPYASLPTPSSDSSEVVRLIQISDSLVYDEPLVALELAEDAVHHAEQLGEKRLLAKAIYSRASALWSKGDLSLALEALQQGLAYASEVGDDVLIARCYIRLGTLFSSVEDNTPAIRYYRLALEVLRDHQEWDLLIVVFNNLGRNYSESGKLDSAEYYLQRAYWLVQDRSSFMKPIVLFNMGEAQYLKGDHEASRSWLEQCVSEASKRDDRRALIRCNQLLAEIELAAGNIPTADSLSDRAVALAQISMSRESLQVSTATRAKVLFALGEYESAYQTQSLALAYRDSLQAVDIKNRLNLFEFQRREKELEDLRKQQAIVEMRQDLQQVWILTTGLVAALAIILAYYFHRSRKMKTVANQMLELKNSQIASQAKELKDLNSFKTKLIAIISHDLKSPIQGLIGVTELLKSKLIDPKELNKALPSITSSLKHCNNKIHDLLKWSGGSIDERFLKKEVFDIDGVMLDAIAELKEDAEQKGVKVDISDFAGLRAVADPNILQTVVRNMLHNAIKYSRKGGKVVIEGTKEGTEVIISITDRGVGMSPDQLSNLFKVRKDAATGTVGELGSGIGLIICRDLLRMMKGRIWALSEEGEGSTFNIALPAGKSMPRKRKRQLQAAL